MSARICRRFPVLPLSASVQTRLASSSTPSDYTEMLGLFGILMAFGHSVLAMSGEETLAQVNREIEHPKLKNLKRAAIVIAIYSLLFTGLATLLAGMLIPDAVRVPVYKDNLIAGLAMYMAGPQLLRIIFRIFVVVVGFLILSGAINTSIIGSTGVLMRVAEDGVLTDWFRKPNRRFGTSYRIVNLVAILQLFTIIVTRGNVITLGEAYAFGVIWSFTFNALAMLVLRWKYKGARGWKVPPNIRIGKYRDSHRPDLRLHGAVHHRHREPVHQIRRHRQRHRLRRGLLHYLLVSPSGRTSAATRLPTARCASTFSSSMKTPSAAKQLADQARLHHGHHARCRESVGLEMGARTHRYR